MADIDFQEDPAPSNAIDFQEDASPVTPTNNVTASADIGMPGSRTDSFLRGFANSGSFGVGKWVNALAGATLNKFGNETSDNDPVLASIQASTPKTGSFWGDIVNSVKGQKADNAEAFNAHPAAYIGGAVAPAVIGVGATAAGKVATGVLGSLGGQVAVGGTTGAVSGASEATNAHDAAINALVGGTVGTVGSAIIGGTGNLLTKFGQKGAISQLDQIMADVRSGNDKLAQPALAKLKDLYQAPKGKPGGNTALSERDLLDAAQRSRDAIAGIPGLDKIIQTHQTGDVIKSLAPGVGALAKDAYKTAVQSAPGALAEHFLSGGDLGRSAIVGLGSSIVGPASRQLITDSARFGAARMAGSPIAQGAIAASPFAVGATPQSVEPLGLTGVLGNYIDNVWRK